MLRALSVFILYPVLQWTVSLPAIAQQSPDLLQQVRDAYRNGRFDIARKLLIEALERVPANDDALRAQVLADLGDVYTNEDDYPKAEQAYRKSLEIYRSAGHKTKTAMLLRSMAALYSTQRRDDEALRVSKEALKIARSAPKPDEALLSQVLNTMGVIYYRLHNLKRAEKLFNEALKLIPAADLGYNRADIFNNLGVIYYEKHDFSRAEQSLLQGLHIGETQSGAAHPDLIFSLASLGMLYNATGDYATSEQYYGRAISILRPYGKMFETRMARLLFALGRTLYTAGRTSEGEAALLEATTIARRNVSEHSDMAAIMEEYAGRLKRSGKLKEAEELRVEAKRARIRTSLVINAHHP